MVLLLIVAGVVFDGGADFANGGFGVGVDCVFACGSFDGGADFALLVVLVGGSVWWCWCYRRQCCKH